MTETFISLKLFSSVTFVFRFIATGTELLSAIVINSAGIFDFKTAYNLDEKQVLA